MTTETPAYGTVARIKTEQGEKLALYTAAWTGAGRWVTYDGFMLEPAQVPEYKLLVVLPPEVLNMSDVFTKAYRARTLVESLWPLVNSTNRGKTAWVDANSAVNTLLDELKKLPNLFKQKEEIPEPKNFGAVVLVNLGDGHPKPFQLTYEGSWEFGEAKMSWFQIKDNVVEIVFDGVKI